MKIQTAICAALIATAPLAAMAHSDGHWGYRHGGGHRSSRSHSRLDDDFGWPEPRFWVCNPGMWDSRGRLQRCAAARAAFQRDNPCPSTGEPRGPCPGYIVDHIIPLKRGGADDPTNMQWQTVEDAKAKDKVE